MWTKSENSSNDKPAALEASRNGMIVRRNFRAVAATEEAEAHWSYDEWQMSREQYEVYQAMLAENADIEDALMELAEIIMGGE